MSLQQEITTTQSLFGQLLQSNNNLNIVVKTLLNAAYHSWKIQAPDIVIRKPVKDTLYINAGVAWNINDNLSIVSQEHLNEDITLFTVQEISFWIRELWNLNSVEEFSEADVADSLGSIILEYVEKQNFFSHLQFDEAQLKLQASDYQITKCAEHMNIKETTVSFPINVLELLQHFIDNDVFPPEMLNDYKTESKQYYNANLPKLIYVEGNQGIVKSTREVLNSYIETNNKSYTLAIKIAALSSEKKENLKQQKIAKNLEVIDTDYLYDEISAVVIKRSEDIVFTLEEIKFRAWQELTKSLNNLFIEIIPHYKDSIWDNPIRDIIPYESIKSYLVTHNTQGKEISFLQEPSDEMKEVAREQGSSDKFKLKVNCVFINAQKVLEIIQSN